MLGADFLELESLAPHQQQSHDVSEINPAWIGLPFETLKAINQQVFVDVQPASFALGRNSANPKPEGPGRRSLNDPNASCSFCGQRREQVRKLISGPRVFICDECVGLCVGILEED